MHCGILEVIECGDTERAADMIHSHARILLEAAQGRPGSVLAAAEHQMASAARGWVPAVVAGARAR